MPHAFMAICIFLMREIEGHLNFQQFLLFSRLLVSITLLVEGEPYENSLDNRPFFVNFLIFFRSFAGRKFYVSEESIFSNNDIEVIFLDTEDLHRHNRIPFQGIWSFFEQIEEDLFIFHDSFRISRVSKAAHDLSLHQFLIVV